MISRKKKLKKIWPFDTPIRLFTVFSNSTGTTDKSQTRIQLQSSPSIYSLILQPLLRKYTGLKIASQVAVFWSKAIREQNERDEGGNESIIGESIILLSPNADDYMSKRSISVRLSKRSFREVRQLHTGLPQLVKGSLQSLFRQSPFPTQLDLTINHQQPQLRT